VSYSPGKFIISIHISSSTELQQTTKHPTTGTKLNH